MFWHYAAQMAKKLTRGTSRIRRARVTYGTPPLLLLEPLEERVVPDTYTVNTRIDPPNPFANPANPVHSLRWAIISANNHAGPDVINFDITDVGFVNTTVPIKPGTNLPTITDAVKIDAATKPTGKPLQTITLDGAGRAANNGLTFGLKVFGGFSSGSNSEVYGLTITGFSGDGILLSNVSDVQIGGSGTGQGNILLANNNGIHVSGVLARSNVIVNNRIGTDPSLPDVADFGNKKNGVLLDGGSSSTEVGRVGDSNRNVISANGSGQQSGNNGITIVDSARCYAVCHTG
jgi:hypothetical protein